MSAFTWFAALMFAALPLLLIIALAYALSGCVWLIAH